MTKRKSYSKNAIVDHWLDDGRFFCVMTDVCWICGRCTRFTEKCHIKPLWKGGIDELDNLVLLCRNCHTETEGLPEEQFWFYVEAYPHDLLEQVTARFYALGLLPRDVYKYWKHYSKENPTP